MTQTSFEEFKKLFRRIPKERLEYVNFITLRNNSKIPIERWKEEKSGLSYYEVRDKLKTGWNVAVVARPKGIMFLDIDTADGQLLIPSNVLKDIPDTLTVKTRSGGLHYYFLNNGKWDNQYFIIDGVMVGELRTNWQYVVCAGSWVEPSTYKVMNDVFISEFKGTITKYFKEGMRDKNEIPKLYGKKGKPITEELKKRMEQHVNNNDDRRKQLLEQLKAFKR